MHVIAKLQLIVDSILKFSSLHYLKDRGHDVMIKRRIGQMVKWCTYTNGWNMIATHQNDSYWLENVTQDIDVPCAFCSKYS